MTQNTDSQRTVRSSPRPDTASSRRSLGRFPAVLLLLALCLPTLGLAQSQTRPVQAGAWNQHLEIGPVAGLTTDWHPAPRHSGAPLGETIRLRIRTAPQSQVIWTGAREVERTTGTSIAEVRPGTTGPAVVAVAVETATGERIEEQVLLDVVDTASQPVEVTGIRVTASQVEIDAEDPNTSTMGYYFQGASIAALREVVAGHYLTSIDRWLTFKAEVQPAVFAPLVEWRLDGKPQRHLGGAIRMRVFTARTHAIEAGPEAASAEVALETYIVRIISPRRGDEIPDGAPVTFTAVTDPPGYEDHITWLASTKYGGCDPLMGEGPEFTTEFFSSVGEDGRWLGARADNAIVGKDEKGVVAERIEPSGTIKASLGIDHYEVTSPTERSLHIVVIDDQGAGDETIDLSFFTTATTAGTFSGYTAVHRTGGIEDVRFGLVLTDATGTPDDYESAFRGTLSVGGENFVTRAEIKRSRLPATSEVSFKTIRYSFNGAEFEVKGESYDPSVDDPAFQGWLQSTGAGELFGLPAGLRLALILADHPLIARSVDLLTVATGQPLAMSPAVLSAGAVGRIENDFEIDPLTPPDPLACFDCGNCQASGWQGRVMCKGCFAACEKCGTSLSLIFQGCGFPLARGC